MDVTRRSPPQFGLRFIFIVVTAAGFLSALFVIMGSGIFFLLGLVGAIAVLVAIGRYILGPLDAAARHRMRPTQFTMVDFLALMFLFQLPMAALHARFDVSTEPQVWIFDVFGWIACSLMWGLSVTALSRAGIQKTWQRGLFLALVLPTAYFGSIVFATTLAIVAGSLFVERRLPPGSAGMIAGILAGHMLAFYLSAWFVRKMVAESEDQNSADAGERQEESFDLP